MIHELYVEQVNPNDTEFTLVKKYFEKGDMVNIGDTVLIVEGQKSAIEIESEYKGFFYSEFSEGDVLQLDDVVHIVTDKVEEIEEYLSKTKTVEKTVEQTSDDISLLPRSLSNLSSSVIKVAVLPGGKAFRQVQDALSKNINLNIVGFFDDNRGSDPLNLGGIDFDFINTLIEDRKIDRVFVATGSSDLRTKLLNALQERGIQTINIIHPTAEISESAIIGSNVFIGPRVVVSAKSYIDNGAFISALSNIEHHCIVGENSLLGPGVMLSGSVSIGKRVVLGAGASVESNIQIEDDSYIASGSGITRNIKRWERVLS